MRKIGIGNFQLPSVKRNAGNLGWLLWRRELEELKSMSTGTVWKIALRAVDRAERYACGHPFWNGLADCYLRIGERRRALNNIFPGITRVIHNSEVKRGDVLVCDFQIGMNYGFMNGGTDPVKVRVLEVDGDMLKGEVTGSEGGAGKEIGYFKNELWFFISHRFTVYPSGQALKR